MLVKISSQELVILVKLIFYGKDMHLHFRSEQELADSPSRMIKKSCLIHQTLGEKTSDPPRLQGNKIIFKKKHQIYDSITKITSNYHKNLAENWVKTMVFNGQPVPR